MNTINCSNCGNVFFISDDPRHRDGQESCPICGTIADGAESEKEEIRRIEAYADKMSEMSERCEF